MQKKENEQEEEKGQKKKIMIVDDDVDITNSFSLALEDSGLFEVDTYNDPLVALSNYRPNSYDLLLLDIQMPKMNGFELCINIKKIDSKVKVRFISEYDVDELREQFPSLELDCFNSKDIIRGPIEVNKLIERVQTELLT
jgi:DNA-binding response OmpR family regulator